MRKDLSTQASLALVTVRTYGGRDRCGSSLTVYGSPIQWHPQVLFRVRSAFSICLPMRRQGAASSSLSSSYLCFVFFFAGPLSRCLAMSSLREQRCAWQGPACGLVSMTRAPGLRLLAAPAAAALAAAALTAPPPADALPAVSCPPAPLLAHHAGGPAAPEHPDRADCAAGLEAPHVALLQSKLNLGGAAPRADGPRAALAEWFAEADADRDGLLTAAEFGAWAGAPSTAGAALGVAPAVTAELDR
ncbi:unnamed protein product, partial [Prorocentrum cordatum]